MADFPPAPKWDDRSIIVANTVVARVGATVRWETQITYLIDVSVRRMTKMVQYTDLAIMDGMRKWYNRHAELLNWELEMLHRIQKYLDEQSAPPVGQGALPEDYS